MGEVCGMVFIYPLSSKGTVMNIGRILENFFGSMSFNTVCALQLFLMILFFEKYTKSKVYDLDIRVT